MKALMHFGMRMFLRTGDKSNLTYFNDYNNLQSPPELSDASGCRVDYDSKHTVEIAKVWLKEHHISDL